MIEKPELFMRALATGLGGDDIELRVLAGGSMLQVDVAQNPHGWEQLCRLTDQLEALRAHFPSRRKGVN